MIITDVVIAKEGRDSPVGAIDWRKDGSRRIKKRIEGAGPTNNRGGILAKGAPKSDHYQ